MHPNADPEVVTALLPPIRKYRLRHQVLPKYIPSLPRLLQSPSLFLLKLPKNENPRKCRNYISEGFPGRIKYYFYPWFYQRRGSNDSSSMSRKLIFIHFFVVLMDKMLYTITCQKNFCAVMKPQIYKKLSKIRMVLLWHY